MSEDTPVEVVVHGRKKTVHHLYAHLMAAHNIHDPIDDWPDDPAEMVAAHNAAHREQQAARRIEAQKLAGGHCPGCRCHHPEWNLGPASDLPDGGD